MCSNHIKNRVCNETTVGLNTMAPERSLSDPSDQPTAVAGHWEDDEMTSMRLALFWCQGMSINKTQTHDDAV